MKRHLIISLIILSLFGFLNFLWAKNNDLESKMSYLVSLPIKRYHGPNCWNSVLYLSGLSHQVRFSSQEEFNTLMESKYCQKIQSPRYGDIQIYRAVLEGLNGYGQEIHANIWLDSNWAFNKMTGLSTSNYSKIKHEEVDINYAFLSSVFRLNQQVGDRYYNYGCEEEKCKNKVEYRRCSPIPEIEKDILDKDFLLIYNKIIDLEKDISDYLFMSILAVEEFKEFESKLLKIDEELLRLKVSNNEEEWQLEYFKSLLISLQGQIKQKQPFWLN